MVDLGTPSKSSGRQDGTKNRPRGEQMVKQIDTQRFRDRREKREYMQKRLVDWTFVFLIYLYISSVSGTAVNKYMICSFVFPSAKYKDKHQADGP